MNKQENKNSQAQTTVWVARGKGVGEVVKGKGGQVYGDGRRFDFGWWAHNAIYRSCITEVYI